MHRSRERLLLYIEGERPFPGAGMLISNHPNSLTASRYPSGVPVSNLLPSNS